MAMIFMGGASFARELSEALAQRQAVGDHRSALAARRGPVIFDPN
jgi:hypothetical protein